MHEAGKAEVVAGFDFAFYIELGGGIFSDEHGGQAGADVMVKMEVDGIAANFGEDFVADFTAVQKAREHTGIIAWGRKVIRGP